ncbi:MAG: hypothetical protein DCC71_06985 [Proteobacteria bacterium]|nr:MAG: hypothetical protein DCC71_06985 [Pseudomonadota bacterium]
MQPKRGIRAIATCLAVAAIGAPIAPARARAAAYVISTCQACYGNAAGDCETTPPILTPGAPSNILRTYGGSDGYSFQAAAASTTDFAAFGLFARASGFVDPPGDDATFLGNDTRIGRAFGTFSDVVTAGEGGASGFLRIPLHATGSTVVEWQNGASYVQLGLSCSSNLPGSPTTLGPCTGAGRNITTSGPIDEAFQVDVPIVLGQPVQITIQMNLGAGTGYGYGNLVPFAGQAEGSVGADSSGAIVLDAAKSPIPGAPISLGESGHDYQNAPEASSSLAAGAAFAALTSLRDRRRWLV